MNGGLWGLLMCVGVLSVIVAIECTNTARTARGAESNVPLSATHPLGTTD